MNPNEITALVTALAIEIAGIVPGNDELVLLSSIFNQIGDTLGVIAAQRQILMKQ